MQDYNIHINISPAKYSLRVCSKLSLHSERGTIFKGLNTSELSVPIRFYTNCITAIPMNFSASDFSSKTKKS